jgi:hypothetical protein
MKVVNLTGFTVQRICRKLVMSFCVLNEMQINLQRLDASNTVRGSNSIGVDFPTRRDQSGAINMFCNGYRVSLPGVQQTGRGV